MLFNEFLFLILVLPLACILFFFPPLRRYRVFTILVISFVFYEFSGGVRHLVGLAIGIVWVYFFSTVLDTRGRKLYLFLSISFPALALIYFKYRYFLLEDVLGLRGGNSITTFSLFEQVVLPAGISFFTFQLISYAIDRYRGGQEKPKDIFYFAFYISFFPQLVAGPILRYDQVRNRLNSLEKFKIKRCDAVLAVVYFVFGLAFKVLIADSLGETIEPLIVQPSDLGVLSRLYLILAYSNQIYFDFFGYSLMAMGMGHLFGFAFPLNFRMPYTALTPRDFWRRWHVTLSYWIRDYIYKPLGGRKRYVVNIIIVFVLCGLWHGAGWNFVIWGAFHGGLVVLYALTSWFWDARAPIIQWAVTFGLVSIGWILFIFDVETSYHFIAGFFSAPLATESQPSSFMWIMVFVSTFIAVKIDVGALAAKMVEGKQDGTLFSVLCAVIFCTSLVLLDQSTTFIYFRF